MLSQIKNYLSVSKKEWNGMVILVILIALVLAAPYVFKLLSKDNTIGAKDLDKALALLEKKEGQKSSKTTSNSSFYKKAAPGIVIELNIADSAKLTELKGIGPSFARRIITYRNHLGGFVKKEQLLEVFGLDSERYAGLKSQVSVNALHIKKIHINSVNFDGLKYFPYLTYKQMNAIIQFREQHGDYESLADLGNIVIMDKPTLKKIKPYITFK